MALNLTGAISLAGTTVGESIQLELNGNGSTTISLNDTAVRTLAGVPSGTITMPTNFYGKANIFNYIISSNTTNLNLRAGAVAAGWNQSSILLVTINSGVYVSATSTGTAALTVNGTFPQGVTLTNNGFIVGKGGKGGDGGDGIVNTPAQSGVAGSVGGLALSVASPITINNLSGTVAGAGGGGAGGSGGTNQFVGSGGSGGGGGRSGLSYSAGGTAGTGTNQNGLPGTAGTEIAAGTGGAGQNLGTPGGNGGNWGSAGATIGITPGGAAGACTSGNSNITWTNVGTRIGALN